MNTGPEFSPDGGRIVFTRNNPRTNLSQIMLMNPMAAMQAISHKSMAGTLPGRRMEKGSFLPSDRGGPTQLFTMNLQGRQLSGITNLPSIRGRSDWSPDGEYIVTYSGEAWNREVYIMNADGSNVRQLTPSGGNSQGPSLLP